LLSAGDSAIVCFWWTLTPKMEGLELRNLKYQLPDCGICKKLEVIQYTMTTEVNLPPV
jgi:hypothetical protein